MVWQLIATFKVEARPGNGIVCLIGGTAKRFSTVPWRRDAGILVTIASAQKQKTPVEDIRNSAFEKK